MTGGGSLSGSTSSRGCWFLLVAVVVLGLTVAAALVLLGVIGTGGPAPTPSPVPTLPGTTPYPSFPTPGPSVGSHTSPPQVTPSIAPPTQLTGPRVEGAVTGDLSLSFGGRTTGACPIGNGHAVFSAFDFSSGNRLQVVISAYRGAGTYPVTAVTGSTPVAFEARNGGVVTVYRSTTGTIHTTAKGDGTISADLVPEVGTGKIHFEGTIICP